MRDHLANIISVEKQTYTVIGILCVKLEFQPPMSVQNHHIVVLFDCHFAFGIPVLEFKNFSWLHPVKKKYFLMAGSLLLAALKRQMSQRSNRRDFY